MPREESRLLRAGSRKAGARRGTRISSRVRMAAKRPPSEPEELGARSARRAVLLAGEMSQSHAEVLRVRIEARILWLRGEKVLLGRDLAGLYGVSTKQLNQEARRIRERFLGDFLLEIMWKELDALRSQSVTLDETSGRDRHRKYPPLAKSEIGRIGDRSQNSTLARIPVVGSSTPAWGGAAPEIRSDLLFVGSDQTIGGAPELVIPNGPIPPDATIRILGP